MDFNSNPKKQAVEVCISCKIVSNDSNPLSFNQSKVKILERHKQLGLILDTKLTQRTPWNKINKCNRIIGYINLLSLIIPRTCLLTFYKAFVRPYLDYADTIYDKPDSKSFKDWLEKIQYNVALAITGAIRGTLLELIYNELGLKSLADRQSYRKITFFKKEL